MRAMVTGDWTRALVKLEEAETGLDAVLTGAAEEEHEDLREERALCEVHRADVAIRYWRIGEAEAALDRAYAVLKKGSVEAELWRVTARIAERQGRWSSARAAWKKADKLASSANEAVAADARLRLAEIALHEGKGNACRALIDQVRGLGIEDPQVTMRVRILQAEIASMEGEIDVALDAWKDLARALDGLPQDFVALANLRRAGTEVHRAPVAAVRRVLRAAELLERIAHPDALGLAYGQLAVLATALRNPVLGALSAVGANAARDGDTVAHSLLQAALERAELDIDVENLERRQLQEALVGVLSGPARELGVAWSDLGTLKGLEKLAAPLKAMGTAGIRVDVESGQIVHAAQLVGHRSTLTWDAPLGVLRTVVLERPMALPKRPQLYAPASPAGIQATPPPTLVRADDTRQTEIRLIGMGTAVAVTGFFGVLALVALALILGRAPKGRAQTPPVPPAPITQPVERPVVAPTSEGPVFEVLSDASDPAAKRVPTVLSSTNMSRGVVTLVSPSFQARWRPGAFEFELPPGDYAVDLDGVEQDPIRIEDSERCRLRWIGKVIVAACD